MLRGLDLLDMVATGPLSLSALSTGLRLTKSTTHRLAAALVDRGFLAKTPRQDYALGPRLLELGHAAQRQTDLTRVARPWLERLAAVTRDTVRLAVRDGDQALCVDLCMGQGRLVVSGRVGGRIDLLSSALGKALLLDASPEAMQTLLSASAKGARDSAGWLERMHQYAHFDHAFDLEENDEGIRCVAAPIRDKTGAVVASIGVSAAAGHAPDARMAALAECVRNGAEAISRALGQSRNPSSIEDRTHDAA
ncbi:IclR family transcriptional regulator [Brevundimonas intermedia]